MNFKGGMTALITPLDENNEFNEEGFRQIIDSQIKGGIDGIVPVGTTGECATLSYEEHEKVVEVAVDAANGRVPVIAGTGSNSTREALRLTRHAKEVGADGVLLVAPYYNKPTQRGLYEHYKTLAEEIEIPQIIYNIPSRTGRNIEAETLIKLSKLDNVAGVKEASGDLNQVMKISRETRDNDFNVLSGDDSLTLPILSLGGVGVISVASNLLPGKISELVNSYLDGDPKRSREIHFELMPLFEALFIETNPGPVKAAMNLLGDPAGRVRPPLVDSEPETKERLREVLTDLGLMSK
ncbi:MAG: 4-hydroxy-tetrahydrodipicolinate synthase [Hadesarchaea archaeon]|nr:4-hydroxy-tetrahydrodipicolinate synthase [Hadesarchaea archaeon]